MKSHPRRTASPTAARLAPFCAVAKAPILGFALAAVLTAGVCLAAEPITTTLTGYPLNAVEGSTLSFTVHYDVAPKLGTVQLHVELKDPKQVVLTSQVAEVSGKGAKTLTFDVPPASQESTIFFAVWYGPVWTQAIVPILQSDNIQILTRAQAAQAALQRQAADRWRQKMASQLKGRKTAAVFLDDFPGLDHAFTEKVIARLKARGFNVITLTAGELVNVGILSTKNFRTLVLTNSAYYPADGGQALEGFLSGGGHLIALNTPALRMPVVRVDGKWMTGPQIQDAVKHAKPARILYSFEKASPADWSYTSSGGPAARIDFSSPGHEGTGHSLHVVVPDFEGWNTFKAPELTHYFAPGQTLTTLWARGDAKTPSLSIEWDEKDGSRWIGVIPLKTKWQYYVLTPWDFKYWPDNPSKGRGGPGDHFHPENAANLTVGLAQTHTPMPGGHHEFWVDDIGVATSPLGGLGSAGPATKVDLPPVENLTPTYKFYKVTNAVSLRVSDKQCLLAPASLPVPEGLMSAQPRPQGTGYDKARKWRWIPLLESFDKAGEVCGTPAVLTINRTGPYTGSMIASFSLPPAAYANAKLLGMVLDVVSRMRDGYFLFEGGAQYYAYFAGQDMTLGARTINLSGKPAPRSSVRLVIKSGPTEGHETHVVYDKTLPLADGQAEAKAALRDLQQPNYQVTCTLLGPDGKVLDMLTHPVVVWRANPHPDYITVRDGHFWLDGKRWRAHGVNYMPSSGVGTEDGPYFEYWMGSQPYDPVVIERDLQRIKAIGLNAVSIFCYYRSLGSHNLLDILERCRRLGLKVNLSLRPGNVLDFHWDEMKALIQAYRLAENATVFAYDMAWEPSWGNHDRRVPWDGAWEKWIVERYGSIAAAEADWGVKVPRTADGKVTNPSDKQMSTEGAPDHIMIAAYRRFLDDFLAENTAHDFNLVKSIDPHHFTSFRMSIAGDPTVNPAWLGYDFRGLARSVDIMEPEGYGRIGDWDRVRDGRFTIDYARCGAPGRPVMWAEFGNTSWDMRTMADDPARNKTIGEFYDNFYRMIYDSDGDGSMCWYYPGGFRYGENSDFGIINPDGSWRPVTRAIHDWAQRMTHPGAPKPVDERLTFDRDKSVEGVVGAYNLLKKRFWAAVAAGKNPGLRDDGYGLTSATAPRLAVGDVPYKPGANPPKYLDAEFDSVEIRAADGKWQTVTDGATVKVRRGHPLHVRATAGNINEATWLAQEGDGQVSLAAVGADGKPVGDLPIAADVPFQGATAVEGDLLASVDAPVTVTLEMAARPDLLFGQKVTVKVEPQ